MIDYHKISDAIDCYAVHGYVYRDVPWLLDKQSVQLAAPEGVRQFETFMGCLPASGEQSFYHQMTLGLLAKGRWQTVTPCFRDEPVTNNLTRTHFLKLELIDVDPDDVDWSLDIMVDTAYKLMYRLGVETTRMVQPDGSIDLVSLDGVELGSYGVRHIDGYSWVYGTGLAEPRFSRVCEVDGL